MGRKSILDDTTNLVKLFLHICGTTEVPVEFNVWACISMVAAAVADRVHLAKFRDKKLSPNLYVALIGPSAIGKGEAIDNALRLVRDLPRVNVYAGKASAQHLIARMGQARRDDHGRVVLENSKMFLVTPELSMSLGKGDPADAFIKHMTELYTGREYPLRDGTVTRGEVILRGHCLNWLAGTTKEWLMDCVPKEAISGGFFGRMVAVEAKYDLDRRIVRPIYPPDFDEVIDHVQARIRVLSHLDGPIEMTAEAREIEEHWYMNRPSPTDPALIPAWRREHDLMLKLAMILSLADTEDLVIRRHHVQHAQQMSARVLRAMPGLIAYASTTDETAGIQMIAELCRTRKIITHALLAKHVWNRGVGAERLKQHIEMLVQSKQMKRVASNRGQMYQWTGRRRLPLNTTNGAGPGHAHSTENEDE